MEEREQVVIFRDPPPALCIIQRRWERALVYDPEWGEWETVGEWASRTGTYGCLYSLAFLN